MHQKGHRHFRGQGNPRTKGFKSATSKNQDLHIHMGQNHFAAQFTQSRKTVANYLQCAAADEGYLVAKNVRTEKEQRITLLAPVDARTADADDQRIIREEAFRVIAKRKAKHDNALKKGFATVYDQCLLKVRDKLEASDG
jgi:hypothetical protein